MSSGVPDGVETLEVEFCEQCGTHGSPCGARHIGATKERVIRVSDLDKVREQGAEEMRTAYEKARDQLDEAADKQPQLEDLASLLIRDGSAEVRENAARELEEIADILGKLPQRAIGDDTHFDQLENRLKEAEAERDEARKQGAEEERERLREALRSIPKEAGIAAGFLRRSTVLAALDQQPEKGADDA